MRKYQKLTLEESNFSRVLHSKEKALLEKMYQFPSVDSLTYLNSANPIKSDGYLKALSQNSLQNIDQSHLLDISMLNQKLPQSAQNLSHMKSLVLNKKLAKKEKSNFEDDQKRIFESHLNYISKHNQVLDKLKGSLPTSLGDINKDKNSSIFLPAIQTTSASMSSLPTKNAKTKQYFISPKSNQNENINNNKININNNNKYSQSVQPTQRKKQEEVGSEKVKANDIFEQIMQQLSIKKKEKHYTSKDTESSYISPSARNESNNTFKKQEEKDLHIPELSKLSLTIAEQNTHRKVSDLFVPQSKRSSDRSVQNTPMNGNNMSFDQATNQVRRSIRMTKRGPLFHQFEDQYNDGQIGSNIEDKFKFFKKTPVGSIITISKRSVSLKDMQSPKTNKLASVFSPSKENKNDQNQTHSMSQYFQQQQTQTKREEELKNKSILTAKTSSISQANNQYLDILKKQAQIQRINRHNQDQKFCQMSRRMSLFFQDENNFEMWERYVLLCRHFKRFIDVLFKLEKNLNKNMNYIIRLTGTKKYLVDEIIDQQFHFIHFGAIEALENTLISENTIKQYFKVDQDLKTIISEYYIKDLSYINGQFEVYLNNQQIIQSSKVSEIIQAEFKMIKQKEKDLIFDQFDNTGIKNLNYKKSYQFFNDYLYNIQPRRNTYKEIQEFEKNFGQFQYLSQIDRDMFQNLEKSYNKIRSTNKS